MSKRPLSSCCSSCRAAKRPAQRRQHHLYLVLGDWEKGHSIHKVDVAAFDPDAGGVPPVVRVEAKHRFSQFFAAHGSKILAMFPVSSSPGVPVFDTSSRRECPSTRGHLATADGSPTPLFASLRGLFFKITSSSIEMLGLQPPAVANDDKPWAWHDITAFAEPPFDAHQAVCHALHPDGRAHRRHQPSLRDHGAHLLLGRRRRGRRVERTAASGCCRSRGRPTTTAGLDAWVGLCRHREGLGHACSCDLAPPLSASGESPPPPPPRWREAGAHGKQSVLPRGGGGAQGRQEEVCHPPRAAHDHLPYKVADEGLADLSSEPVAFWL